MPVPGAMTTTITSAAAAALAIEEALLVPCTADLTPIWEECFGGWGCDCPSCEEQDALEAKLVAEAKASFSFRIAAVYCCKCDEPLAWDKEAQRVTEPVAVNAVYKCGEHKYDELAHVACAPEWPVEAK